jgi:hypothetical protein
MIIIQMILFTLLLASVIYTVSKWRTKYLMEKAEKELFSQGILPSGAGVCHGMTFKQDEHGVNAEYQESLAWYSRIFRAPY